MIAYLLKRLLLFIPTVIVVSLIAFALSKIAPGDPVELRNTASNTPVAASPMQAERMYRETAHSMGLDKPAFYFALSSAAYPKELYQVLRRDHRQTLRKLIGRYGNWPAVQAWHQSIQRVEEVTLKLPSMSQYAIARPVRELYTLSNEAAIRARLDTLSAVVARDSVVQVLAGAEVAHLVEQYAYMTTHPTRHKLYWPALYWYGLDNQYHRWFAGLWKGDWGTSYRDGRPVARKIAEALRWTLLLNLIAVALSFGLSIPIGVWSAQRAGSRSERGVSILLFALYSLPVFWVATLLQVFFTTPEYGMDWFPTTGLSELPRSAPWHQRLLDQAAHLTLPVLCLTYGSLAFISRQMRGSMMQALLQDYVRTARAKGLPEGKVVWRHAFRNALFPIITLISSVFPAVLAGSVVIEVIFGIPGMGKLTVESIFARDWPVVFAMLMLGALLTTAGFWIADLLYAWADPRVRYQRRG